MYETNVASPLTWDIFSQQERKISQQAGNNPQVMPGVLKGDKPLKDEVISAVSTVFIKQA